MVYLLINYFRKFFLLRFCFFFFNKKFLKTFPKKGYLLINYFLKNFILLLSFFFKFLKAFLKKKKKQNQFHLNKILVP